MSDEVFLFFDDTGSREPDHVEPEKRRDGMDCFGLGGILINEEDIDALFKAHKDFCSKWGIDYPLHSSPIRGGRGKFGWLKQPEASFEFLTELEQFLISLPVIGIAAVIDRPGYVARYKKKYDGKPWLMCKTACTILIERAAKYADSQERHLRVFFEGAGPAEDGDIKNYVRAMKKGGMPFDGERSKNYGGLSAEDLKRIIRSEPRERTKKTPMIQIADLYLYPMAKGGYDPEYRPYEILLKHKKLIDALLTEDERKLLGIKYSCFDDQK